MARRFKQGRYIDIGGLALHNIRQSIPSEPGVVSPLITALHDLAHEVEIAWLPDRDVMRVFLPLRGYGRATRLLRAMQAGDVETCRSFL
jgi:hypothetical protein